jgi:4-amino-4-deoxy-L-arabinose transferase-like glycosyltransferase
VGREAKKKRREESGEGAGAGEGGGKGNGYANGGEHGIHFGPLTAPPPSEPAPAPPGTRTIVIILVALGICFLAGSSGREPWSPDEPRTALLARDMVEGGRWIIPEYEGKPYLDQPPLASWLAAASERLTRLDPHLSYRLPVSLFAVIGLWITYIGGRRLFGGRVAFLAVLIQASAYYGFRRASWLDDDLYFAVGCEAAILGFSAAVRKGGPRFAALGAWTGLALACLAKSVPFAVALVLPLIIVQAFVEGGLTAVKRSILRIARPLPIIVWLVLVLPWHVAAMRHGMDFINAHLVGQHLARFWSSPWDARPIFQYIVWLPGLFLPWTLFLPLAFLHGKDRWGRDGERLCFFWAIIALVILSLASCKKPGYALVLWPPLALLIAAALNEETEWFSVWEDYLREGVFRVVPYLLRVPLAIAGIVAVLYIGGWWRNLADDRLLDVLSDRSRILPLLFLALAATAASFWFSRRIPALLAKRNYASAAFDLATAALILFAVKGLIDPLWNGILSKRDLLAVFEAKLPADATVALYGRHDPEVNYYLRRPVERFEYPDPLKPDDPARRRLEEVVRGTRPAFIIAAAEDLERLRLHFPSLAALLVPEAEGVSGLERQRIILLSNRRG